MAESIDFSTGKPLRAPEPTRQELHQRAWEAFVEEIRNETGIPVVSKAYYDKANEFEIRLRGTPDRVKLEFGIERLMSRGIMPNLNKNFTFKGEGKTAWAMRSEMEKWSTQIIKWARSLDGKAEMEAAEHGKGQAPVAAGTVGQSRR